MKTLSERLAKRDEKGFTLIELVIVVAIIGILTAIAIPTYGAIQLTARQNSVAAAVSSQYSVSLAAFDNGEAITQDEFEGVVTAPAPASGEAGIRIRAFTSTREVTPGKFESVLRVDGVWVNAKGQMEWDTERIRQSNYTV